MLLLLFSKLWHKATFSAMAILATFPLSSLKNHEFMKAFFFEDLQRAFLTLFKKMATDEWC